MLFCVIQLAWYISKCKHAEQQAVSASMSFQVTRFCSFFLRLGLLECWPPSWVNCHGLWAVKSKGNHSRGTFGLPNFVSLPYSALTTWFIKIVFYVVSTSGFNLRTVLFVYFHFWSIVSPVNKCIRWQLFTFSFKQEENRKI